MKNEPTQLELFQAERIKALEEALRQAESENEILQTELNGIALSAYGLASMARIGKESIRKTVNDPVFQEKIRNIDYSLKS